MDERAFLIANDNIRDAIAVEVRRRHLRADAGVVINLVGDELDTFFFVATQLEPIDNRGRFRFFIVVRAVRPEALASEDVGKAVTVDGPGSIVT